MATSTPAQEDCAAADVPSAVADRSKLGELSSVISGVLFLLKAVLDLIVGDPPPGDPQVLAWVTSHRTLLAFANEALAIAAVLLLPVAFVLYRRLDAARRPWAAFGCAAIAAAVPLLLGLAIVHGRLVYPVYDIRLDDPATVALVVSLYYGAAHMVALLLAMALIVVGLAMRGGPFGRTAAAVGVGTGAAQILGSYPWLIGPVPTFTTQAIFAAWLIYLGACLRRVRTEGSSR